MALANDVDCVGPPPGLRIMATGPAVRPCLAIAASVCAFALLIERAGYLPAVVAAVFIASRGSRELSARQALIVAALIAAVMAVLFVGLLDQPLPLIASF